MYLERPEQMTLVDAEGFGSSPNSEARVIDAEPIIAAPQPWQTVGHLYRGIEAGLAHLCERYGEAAVFIGAPSVQATTEIFEWEELTAVTDLASARRAIDVIVEQGEGASGDWVHAHFGKFVGILEDYLATKAADPSFNPARRVEPAYFRLPADVETGILIEDALTARVAELCNGLYEVILQVLCRYYVHQDETPDELDTLARTAKHLMNWVLRVSPQHSRRCRSARRILVVRPVRPWTLSAPPSSCCPTARPRGRSSKSDSIHHRDLRLARPRAGAPVLAGLPEKLSSMAADFGAHLDERAAT